ncbi:hypothetical protein E2C01_020064 [Portunus trituberculatus]|uniref:Uncharacterized protein n=1 Tax=Portunus trituberculatus TaxID=210409 RepID=A0A5B7E135_PORTR|nr:hypothetical protein [Portunus trituberculatus]
MKRDVATLATGGTVGALGLRRARREPATDARHTAPHQAPPTPRAPQPTYTPILRRQQWSCPGEYKLRLVSAQISY